VEGLVDVQLGQRLDELAQVDRLLIPVLVPARGLAQGQPRAKLPQQRGAVGRPDGIGLGLRTPDRNFVALGQIGQRIERKNRAF